MKSITESIFSDLAATPRWPKLAAGNEILPDYKASVLPTPSPSSPAGNIIPVLHAALQTHVSRSV